MKALLWILIVLAVATGIAGPVGDPDLWWHITVGRWIVSHQALPTVDHWNLFAAGTPWKAYSWSNEVLFAVIDGALGIDGLMLLTLAIAFLLTASICFSAVRVADDWIVGTALGIVASCACYAHFGPRPQVVSWICFAWALLLADAVGRNGWSAGRVVSMAAVFALWANSHLTAILGLGAVLLWSADFSSKGRLLRSSGLLAAICIAGTLCTPYLGGEWLTLAEKTDHPFAHMYITEFQPASLYHAAVDLVLLLFVVLCLFLHRQPYALTLTQLAAGAMFLFAAFTIQKFIPYAAIMNALLIARVWRQCRTVPAVLGNLGAAVGKGRHALSRAPTWVFGLAVIGSTVTIAANAVPLLKNPLDLASTARIPVDFIIEHDLGHPILGTFDDGGYLLYRFSDENGVPAHRPAVDGRTNVNTPDAVSAFLAALRGQPDWRRYFEMTKPQTVLWPNSSPLVTLLLEGRTWCHVFPPAEDALTRSRWSVFVPAGVLEERPGLHSRNCPAPRVEELRRES